MLLYTHAVYILFVILLHRGVARKIFNIVHTLSLRALYALVTTKNLLEGPSLEKYFTIFFPPPPYTHSSAHYRGDIGTRARGGTIALLIRTGFF